MINVKVDQAYRGKVIKAALKQAASTTLKACLDEVVSLTVVIAGDERVRSLNNEHRNVDAATDVLSFPADYVDPDLGHRYLGDVVISLPTAEAQAKERGHGLEEELQLLVVHGVLHLLGHDHLEKDDRQEMWSTQGDILAQLGLDLDVEDGS